MYKFSTNGTSKFEFQTLFYIIKQIKAGLSFSCFIKSYKVLSQFNDNIATKLFADLLVQIAVHIRHLDNAASLSCSNSRCLQSIADVYQRRTRSLPDRSPPPSEPFPLSSTAGCPGSFVSY